MAPKRAQKMSMTELNQKFGGNPMKGMLPTRSEGKEEQRRGFRGGFDRGDEEGSSNWRGGGGKGDGKGGDRDRDRDFGRGDEDSDWRGGGNRGPRGGGGFGDRGGGGFGDRGGGGFGDRGGDRRAPPVSADWKDALRKRPGDAPAAPVPSRAAGIPAPKREPKPEKKAKAFSPEKRAPAEKVVKQAKPDEPEKPTPDEARLEAFRQECEQACSKRSAAAFAAFAKSCGKGLTEVELESAAPCGVLAAELFHACRGGSEEDVRKLIVFAEPAFEWLWEHSPRPEPQLELLFDFQAAAYEFGMPRLSKAAAVVEAVFDALYEEGVVEEPLFDEWLNDQADERPGKIDVVFQTNQWFDWLHTAKVEGESSSSESSSDSSSEEEEEEEDIEANVPQRGKPLMARPVR